ncbi:hypothetical protein U4T61_05180, partial [Escherichia coli]|nr:hypothetical protein [Escherichia coli]
ADRNRSHWSTSKTPSYTKSVSWQHHRIKTITYLSDIGCLEIQGASLGIYRGVVSIYLSQDI